MKGDTLDGPGADVLVSGAAADGLAVVGCLVSLDGADGPSSGIGGDDSADAPCCSLKTSS